MMGDVLQWMMYMKHDVVCYITYVCDVPTVHVYIMWVVDACAFECSMRVSYWQSSAYVVFILSFRYVVCVYVAWVYRMSCIHI